MEQTANFYDVVVIGGGPAGLTAALYLARARYRVVVVEKDHFGGQITITSEVVNYPGVGRTSGTELTETMRKQAEGFGAEFLLAEVTGLELSGDIKTVRTGRGDLRCFGVLLATGAHPRMVGFQGEEQFRGRGVAYCATCDGNFFRDKEVMVVGGGNTAAGDAIYLSRICKKVYLVHRRDKLRATAIYHKRLEDLPNLEFVWNAVPRKLVADEGKLAGVRLEMLETGEERDIAVDGLFVAVGTEPNTEFLGGALQCDETGYIVADESCATEVPGVFAAATCARSSCTRW